MKYTLQNILDVAIDNYACDEQLKPFKKFIKDGDELSAWQTVLGNFNWVRLCLDDLDILDVEKLAKGIAKTWYKNGQLRDEYNYVNGKVNGLCRRWYDNGHLQSENNIISGEISGLYRVWHDNGQIAVEANCVNGKLHGLCYRWSYDGQLEMEQNFV